MLSADCLVMTGLDRNGFVVFSFALTKNKGMNKQN